MKPIYLKIGDHIVSIHCMDRAILDHLETNYSNFVYIQPLPSPDIQVHIQRGAGTPTEDFHVEITSTSCSILYQRSDYIMKVSRDYRSAEITVLNTLALKHALMNLYSAFIIHHSWGIVIHSSCLENSGKAYLFAGQSGAGKSTVAKLSAPRAVLSDEASILRIGSNQIQAFNSPFNSELEVTHFQPACELSAIYLLVQSMHVKTIPLKKSEALLELLDKIFYWSHDRTETSKLITLCLRLIDAVPAYRMQFQKNNLFWELIS